MIVPDPSAAADGILDMKFGLRSLFLYYLQSLGSKLPILVRHMRTVRVLAAVHTGIVLAPILFNGV